MSCFLTHSVYQTTYGILHPNLVTTFCQRHRCLGKSSKSGNKSMLRKYSYATRLQMIGITSLEERRLRGDMIKVYKLLTGKEQIDHRQFFNSADTPYGLRGHKKKLAKDNSESVTASPLLLQRYGQQKLISCLSINLQVQV